MPERLDYPYNVHQNGIRNMDRMARKGGEFLVRGGSGKELVCKFGGRMVSIVDIKDRRLHLSADVNVLDSLHLGLSFCSVQEALVHPDFYPEEFIKLALQYFENKHVQIHEFAASWGTGDKDFDEFMEVYKDTGNEKDAARQTWSGRTMAQHGFTEIGEIDVDKDKIEVRFTKPVLEHPKPSGKRHKRP